jgi:hypothetical protein
MLGTILLILLILLLIGALPSWPHMARWDLGYQPSGLLFALVVVVLILLLTGRM